MSNTITGITLSIILGITLFLGMYLWFYWNTNEAGITVEPKYASIYTNLNSTEKGLDTSLNNIRNAVNKTTEPRDYLTVAFFGLVGLLEVLKLPFEIFNAAINGLYQIATGMEIPSWAFIGIYLAIFTIILFAIIGWIKGEAKS